MILFCGLTLWQKIHFKKSKRFWKFKETNGYGFPSCLFNMPFGIKNKQIPLNSLSLKINVNSPCYTQRVRNEASLSTLRSMSSENNLLMSSKKFNEFFEEHDIRPLSSRHKPYYTQKRAENKEKIKQMKISIQKSLNLFRK